MADKTTLQEVASGPITDADQFRGVQTGSNVRISFAAVKVWVKGWITKTDIALGNVDNTSDVNKPISTATQTALNGKQAFDAQLFSNIPQNSKSADYTLVLTDGEKHIYHPAADANNRTFTIPANASVAFPIGTVITFINKSVNSLSIAITTDTMTLAGTTTTGTRTLSRNGICTAIKDATTEWTIAGTGIA